MDRDSHDPFCRNNTSRFLLSGFLFFLNLNNFASVIEAALGTNGVRKAHGTAIGTGNGVYRGQRILRATAVTASLGMFALWMWGHFLLSPFTYIRRAHVGPSVWLRTLSGQIIAGGCGSVNRATVSFYGFSKVRSFAQEFCLATNFCRFSTQIVVATIQFKIYQATLKKTWGSFCAATLIFYHGTITLI
jgi:hypothetical protein